MTHPTPRWTFQASLFLFAVPAVMFTGCATPPAPGIVETSPNVYKVTVQEKISSDVDPKSRAIRQAMDFAESKGKAFVPVDLQQHDYGVFTDWVRVEYEFKLVDKSDAPAKRTAAADPGQKPDVYAELMKLDDLRKKGILSQAEFESEKKKLLARPN